MTEKEMDVFFTSTLKKILNELQDCAEYIRNLHGKEYDEIREDYAYTIEDLSDIIENIKSIADLSEMDEETIGAVFDYLEEYSDNFIISSDEGQMKKDLDEYKKLEEILDLFYDDGE